MKPYERAAKIKLINDFNDKLASLRREYRYALVSFHANLERLKKAEQELDIIKNDLFVTNQARQDLEEVLELSYDNLTDEEKVGICPIFPLFR